MIIWQDRYGKSDEFTLTGVSSQELKNLIKSIEACNIKYSPWGIKTIIQFNSAIEALETHMRKKW